MTAEAEGPLGIYLVRVRGSMHVQVVVAETDDQAAEYAGMDGVATARRIGLADWDVGPGVLVRGESAVPRRDT